MDVREAWSAGLLSSVLQGDQWKVKHSWERHGEELASSVCVGECGLLSDPSSYPVASGADAGFLACVLFFFFRETWQKHGS